MRIETLLEVWTLLIATFVFNAVLTSRGSQSRADSKGHNNTTSLSLCVSCGGKKVPCDPLS